MSTPPEAEAEAKPAASAPAPRPPGRSVLAADLRITGDMVAEGAIEIMGEVEGSVHARAVTLAQDGRLSGTVESDTVEIRGQLHGTVACQSLTLRSAAQVQADVTYATLAIESGAQVDGTFRRPRG